MKSNYFELTDNDVERLFSEYTEYKASTDMRKLSCDITNAAFFTSYSDWRFF